MDTAKSYHLSIIHQHDSQSLKSCSTTFGHTCLAKIQFCLNPTDCWIPNTKYQVLHGKKKKRCSINSWLTISAGPSMLSQYIFLVSHLSVCSFLVSFEGSFFCQFFKYWYSSAFFLICPTLQAFFVTVFIPMASVTSTNYC